MGDKKSFKLKILPDGVAQITMPDMGGIHHRKADEFMKVFQELMGGEAKDTSTKGHHHHHHHGDQEGHVHH